MRNEFRCPELAATMVALEIRVDSVVTRFSGYHMNDQRTRTEAWQRCGRDAMTKRELDLSVLDEIVRRVVEVAQPERIILFGSAARGEMGRDSDVDLLVVKDGAHRRRLAGRIYDRLYGVGVAVDVVVVTPADVERYRDSHALVIKPALREGTIIYEAVASTA